MYRNIYIYIYHSNSSLLGLGFAPATSTNQTMSILGGSILFGCAPYDSLPSSLIPYHRWSNLGISCSKTIFWFFLGSQVPQILGLQILMCYHSFLWPFVIVFPMKKRKKPALQGAPKVAGSGAHWFGCRGDQESSCLQWQFCRVGLATGLAKNGDALDKMPGGARRGIHN